MACGWCISDTRGGGSHDFKHRPIFATGDITIIRLHCDKKHEANIRSCGISNMCSSLYYWLQMNFPSNFVASLIGKEMIGVVSTASKKQKCSEWLSHLINHMPFIFEITTSSIPTRQPCPRLPRHLSQGNLDYAS